MVNNSELRCRELGEYIVKTKATVRQAAEVFGISKSTVHMDVTKRLSA
ncbi:MAG: sporulation transcriptional regulator SpoIIID, partial [Eubacterium sp.]|nr:sporulation transcriptional regulator SpoIIID [Eubacterium sp.]